MGADGREPLAGRTGAIAAGAGAEAAGKAVPEVITAVIGALLLPGLAAFRAAFGNAGITPGT